MVINTEWFSKGPGSTTYYGVADVANLLQLQVSQELTDALNAVTKTQIQQDLITTFETELTNKVKLQTTVCASTFSQTEIFLRTKPKVRNNSYRSSLFETKKCFQILSMQDSKVFIRLNLSFHRRVEPKSQCACCFEWKWIG